MWWCQLQSGDVVVVVIVVVVSDGGRSIVTACWQTVLGVIGVVSACRQRSSPVTCGSCSCRSSGSSTGSRCLCVWEGQIQSHGPLTGCRRCHWRGVSMSVHWYSSSSNSSSNSSSSCCGCSICCCCVREVGTKSQATDKLSLVSLAWH